MQPTLIQKEIQFCVTTFRSNFGLVLQIGRDVIRLLLSLVQIPEFNQIWSDLINNPAIFQPNFTGIKETALKAPLTWSAENSETIFSISITKNRSQGIYENSNLEKIHKFVCYI